MRDLKFFYIVLLLFSLILHSNPFQVQERNNSAYIQDPNDWQNNATGLSITNNYENKTAGLGFQIKVEDWPFVTRYGGVEGKPGNLLIGPIGIQLGSISVTGDISSTLVNEAVDWSHNELSFLSTGGKQLQIWISRLTPAVLVYSASNSVRFFTGDVSGNLFDGTTIIPREIGPSYPKFVAFQSGGQFRVINLSQNPYTIPTLDQNWMLLWYGRNSHFVDTRKPLSYTSPGWAPGIPQIYGYQADTPILFVFQNQPTTIRTPIEGGAEITFDSTTGYIAFSPLFGKLNLDAIETEGWPTGFPNEITNRAQWWALHLCEYPIGVNETYDYDEVRDSAVINEHFSYLSICSGGRKLAPIPPMLSLVKDDLNVNFSGFIIDSHLNTEYGPYLGIENTDDYQWRITGLKKFVDANRILLYPDESPPSLPQELEQELEEQVVQIIDSGHFAPWIFTDSVPRILKRGDIYWLNSADELYHLIEIDEALPEGNIKDLLTSYIISERNNYPPEDIYNLPLDEGSIRTGFVNSGADIYDAWQRDRPDVFLKNVPLYSFYSLARYCNLINQTISSPVWQKALDALDRDMREQDWASFYWFKGFTDRRDAVVNANRIFSGLIGFIRLSENIRDQGSETLGRALLAKAAVLRLGMVKYPRFLYSTNLTDLPPNQDWQVIQTAHYYPGYIFNYSWSNSSDDVRQVAVIDQYGVFLHDHSGFIEPLQERDPVFSLGPGSAHLTAFRDMAPELARFLGVYAEHEILAYTDLIETIYPHWYAAFAEGALGEEHNLSHPTDSYQVFMFKSLIQNTTPQELTSYIDISWLDEGDLFYIQKQAETIKAYRWVIWNNSIHLNGYSGSHFINLNWVLDEKLPPDTSWTIEYSGPTGDQLSPINNIPGTQLTYSLTGLKNGSVYSIIVKAMNENRTLLRSNILRITPSKYNNFIPMINNR